MENRFREVETKSLPAVRRELLAAFHRIFPNTDPTCVEEAFDWVDEAFRGEYGEYQPIDAKYHDFEHTLQGALCFSRLLEGYHAAGEMPRLNSRMFELGVLAILLHDTGYLKKADDKQGTGAKYTLVHVSRSSDFAAALLRDKDFEPAEIRSVQNMIRCTGVNADLGTIPFQSELEQKVGFALGTADLLGQMAAADYVDKLDILYQEFEESNRYNGKVAGPGVFTSAEDLRKKTPEFWVRYVLPKIEADFAGMHRFLNTSDGSNPYLDRIRANIERLQDQLNGVPA
ncbi:MAG TPA: hypothetical protein VK633_07150 [Verrucomicrobiae bacterium]|nr:hypothetical protein [Verrucomicrobiae bacterium]